MAGGRPQPLPVRWKAEAPPREPRRAAAQHADMLAGDRNGVGEWQARPGLGRAPGYGQPRPHRRLRDAGVARRAPDTAAVALAAAHHSDLRHCRQPGYRGGRRRPAALPAVCCCRPETLPDTEVLRCSWSGSISRGAGGGLYSSETGVAGWLVAPAADPDERSQRLPATGAVPSFIRPMQRPQPRSS
jgi:hypothetical protein